MEKEEILELGVRMRGEFLTATIVLERALDFYLAEYFSEIRSKQDELVLLIFGNERITFGNKVEILNYLCKRDLCDLKTKNPTLLTDLKKIIEVRNILAHYTLLTNVKPENTPIGTIQFMKLKNVSSRINFTESEHNELLDKVDNLTILFTSNTTD